MIAKDSKTLIFTIDAIRGLANFEISRNSRGAAFPTWAHEKFPRVTIWKRQRDKYVRRDNAVA